MYIICVDIRRGCREHVLQRTCTPATEAPTEAPDDKSDSLDSICSNGDLYMIL